MAGEDHVLRISVRANFAYRNVAYYQKIPDTQSQIAINNVKPRDQHYFSLLKVRKTKLWSFCPCLRTVKVFYSVFFAAKSHRTDRGLACACAIFGRNVSGLKCQNIEDYSLDADCTKATLLSCQDYQVISKHTVRIMNLKQQKKLQPLVKHNKKRTETLTCIYEYHYI